MFSTKEIAMGMYEYVMHDFEEIWQEQEEKKLQLMDDCTYTNNFKNIKNPDNWQKLEIIFKKSNMNQMKYRYEGEESDWIDVLDYIMQKPNYKKPKHWVEVFTTFCEQETYSLEFDNETLNFHDIIYRANQALKKWFLPNVPTGKKYNPIYSLGRFTKQKIPYSKYASHIRFSYQP